ncbi:MAG: 2OG-Fe(II) oxygenase, partial [Cellvibrionales bacterium]|nr:2OG-Fe(II) oxygenase [Cellvibrionales bacterium]
AESLAIMVPKMLKKGGRSNLPEFGETYAAWDAYIQSDAFLTYLSKITGIPDLLYDPEYIGAGIHENFQGSRGNIHIDYNYHPTTGFHRRLNVICYITPDWHPSYGGGLKVYESGRKPRSGIRKKIDCLFNRCVIFETTESSWHGVDSIILPEELNDLTRKSITMYFYTKERPEEETAPRHSTIYYPGEVSDKFSEGYTLNAADVKDLTNFQARANALISNLYKEHSRLYENTTKLRERISKQNALIDRLKKMASSEV